MKTLLRCALPAVMVATLCAALLVGAGCARTVGPVEFLQLQLG